MRGIKVKILAGILCLITVGGVCLFRLQEEKEASGKPYIAMITKSKESTFWQSVFAGAGAAATEYNLDVSCDGPVSEEDYQTQNQLVEKAVRNGAEVIVFSAVDYNANSEAINKAAEQGVKIVVIDSDVNSLQVSCRIGTDNHKAGRMAGEAVLAADQEELYIGIVNHDINSANGQQREEGFRERVLVDERVKKMYTINVPSTTEEAREGTRKLLEEYPQINAVVTFNEWTSLGVGWAIRDLQLADRTQVVAFDSNVVSVGMLETGEVDALIVQNPYAMGYLGIERAYDLMNGTRTEETRIDTSTTCVTRDNMYEPECQRILFAF